MSDGEQELQFVGSQPAIDALIYYRNEEKGLTIVFDWPRSRVACFFLRLLGIQVTWEKKE